MKHVQISLPCQTFQGTYKKMIFTVPINDNPAEVIYDDRSLDEMINSGDVEMRSLKYDFGDTTRYSFGNEQKDYQAENRTSGYKR